MPSNLQHLLDIAIDLTRSMGASDRYQRLLDIVRRALPCDATALLRLEGEVLVPLATYGLAPETRGLKFRIQGHPRLGLICAAQGPVNFPEDSPLPDPFDGLIAGDRSARGEVHSCLGCPLRVDGELVGALTADALRPGAFRDLDPEFLSMLGALAGAALRTGNLLEATESLADHKELVARELMREQETRSGQLVGIGPVMERLRADIALVAGSDLTVLIGGETGVGKELVAHAIHAASPWRTAPLIHVNCAALPESIAESELFGHVRGAFTGAEKARPGKFEVAKGGTLFLDEIGELPLSLQPKLLRAIQAGEIQRVGSDEVFRVETRILAATNRDLRTEVTEGRFRADLFHRLNVFPLRVPSLREHAEDIPVLAGYFCDIARRKLGTGRIRLTPEARRLLQAFDWPGNVRELENVVSRMILRASRTATRNEPIIVDGELVASEVSGPRRPGARAPTASTTGPEVHPLRQQVDDFKRTIIEEAVRREQGNWAAAARALGMHRSNLHTAAKRLGLL